ncbi:1-deoxy-D-xylulose-5-phosphate synthase [bacterium BMS3Abin07]|nr:1-deoxy-D-xylulose-5-phosphate synthase [bacterium BMS3Abin07]GBE31531.1 1-deoxy-D-xylulose-5-phosphate synthase [bacterium BMS3Bbin05]HDL20251.1 1-deoxy-D-xylulose-5-phosphate synthase [Nitrospirota bacterium]
MELINGINTPEDIKELTIEDLVRLSAEIRDMIVERVSINGGHLASNLGVVELTIAMNYVFDFSRDRIVWDVGHQCYTHKLLTGRGNDFHTLRKFGGISGFPRRSESRYDAFGTGHSSTSISAALGILEGRDRTGNDFKVLAVIGDGAMTAGLAFEGLNNAGHLKKDLIVILNDNEMSISRNVGALSSYLSRLLTGDFYQRLKKDTRNLIESIPRLGGAVSKIAQKIEDSFKTMFLHGIIFEELGFNYVGPIDGHNIEKLIENLQRIRNNSAPTILHVITKKGKGYEFAEENPCRFHGIGPFEIETGEKKRCAKAPSFSRVFGDTLTELAYKDPRVVAITAAMEEGTGLKEFAKTFPERFYDVGIAEPHAVTFAAGLATQGLRPVVAIYSTFLQRAYDEIIHDVCLQHLPVIFAIDRAGIVGDDGPTHHGVFDISYLRHIPNLCIMAPKNRIEMKQMFSLALGIDEASAIRYPRGKIIEELDILTVNDVRMGEAEIITEGDDIGIIAIGNTVYPAYLASRKLRNAGIGATVVNARFIKPLDIGTISSIGKKTGYLLIVEENAVAGGFGSAVLEEFNRLDLTNVTIKIMGLPDSFIQHGTQEILRNLYGLDEDGICNSVMSLLRQHSSP